MRGLAFVLAPLAEASNEAGVAQPAALPAVEEEFARERRRVEQALAREQRRRREEARQAARQASITHLKCEIEEALAALATEEGIGKIYVADQWVTTEEVRAQLAEGDWLALGGRPALSGILHDVTAAQAAREERLQQESTRRARADYARQVHERRKAANARRRARRRGAR